MVLCCNDASVTTNQGGKKIGWKCYVSRDVMDSKISQFVSQTGADAAVAKDLLQQKDWNVEAAVKIYKFMHNSKPPPGPQKNVEPQHMVPTSAGGVPPAGRAAMVVSLPPKSDVKSVGLQNPARYPSLKRGLSKTTENVEIVTKARDHVLQDINEHDETAHVLETPEFSFVLPDLSKYSEDFRAFLHKDLIETSTLVSLEQAGRLNWWADMGACQRLLPLATTGDGNCLLHAASLAMWGFHDRMLTLRKALFKAMSTTQNNSSLYRRWRWHQAQVNKETGLVYTEDEWRTEWMNLLKLASTKPRIFSGSETSCCDSPTTKGMMERNTEEGDVFYESLEEFHVFLLANVLMRPIIVVADSMLKDSNGEALAPIPFGGIYLPLDCEPSECHRSPLLLTYDASHFSALVAMEHDTSPEDKPGPPAAIPIMDPEFQLLPIHYHIDPGEAFVWKNVGNPVVCKQMLLSHEQKLNLIRRYLTFEQLPISPACWNSTDSEAGSEPRSRAGSMDSNAEESQNGKEKDKSKAAKQLHSVQKAFGSIGKSMSKKLKKNFGSVGKCLKEGSDKERRRPSVGSVTQSTKVSSITLEMLKEKERDQTIMAIRLSRKRPAYQEDMVKNYLMSAQKRFLQDRELRRQHDLEMKKRSAELRSLDITDGVRRNEPAKEMACINSGCEQRGTAATSWLCPGCYEKEKAQAMNFSGNKGAIVTSKPPPYQRPPSVGEIERQNTLLTSGKSKFYTYANEDHSALNKEDSLAVYNSNLNNMKMNDTAAAKGSKDSRSTFSVENVNVNLNSNSQQRPLSHPVSAKPPVNMQRTHVTGGHGQLPPGTAYIVNDLHDDVKLSNKEKSATLPGRFKEPVKLLDFDYATEPPLRPEFGGPPLDMSRPSAFRIKGSADNVHQLSAAVSGSHGSAGVGMQQKCRTSKCEFYGSEATDFLCSTCWKTKQRTLAYMSHKK